MPLGVGWGIIHWKKHPRFWLFSCFTPTHFNNNQQELSFLSITTHLEVGPSTEQASVGHLTRVLNMLVFKVPLDSSTVFPLPLWNSFQGSLNGRPSSVNHVLGPQPLQLKWMKQEPNKHRNEEYFSNSAVNSLQCLRDRTTLLLPSFEKVSKQSCVERKWEHIKGQQVIKDY